jgi:hypothetical protein
VANGPESGVLVRILKRRVAASLREGVDSAKHDAARYIDKREHRRVCAHSKVFGIQIERLLGALVAIKENALLGMVGPPMEYPKIFRLKGGIFAVPLSK